MGRRYTKSDKRMQLQDALRSPQSTNTGYDDDEMLGYALNRGAGQHTLRRRAWGLSLRLASNQTQMSLPHRICVDAKSRCKPVAERLHD